MPHVIVKLVPGKIRTGENSTRRSILGNPTMIADASSLVQRVKEVCPIEAEAAGL